MTFLDAVQDERVYQDEKWGWKHRAWAEWGIILGAEVGEVNSALKAMRWDFNGSSTIDDLRSELIQVAAVAAAMIQQIEELRDGR